MRREARSATCRRCRQRRRVTDFNVRGNAAWRNARAPAEWQHVVPALGAMCLARSTSPRPDAASSSDDDGSDGSSSGDDRLEFRVKRNHGGARRRHLHGGLATSRAMLIGDLLRARDANADAARVGPPRRKKRRA